MEEGKFGYDYQRGHEGGIIIAKHAPELAEKIRKLTDVSPYVAGLQDGLILHERFPSESHGLSIELKNEPPSLKSGHYPEMDEKKESDKSAVADKKGDGDLIEEIKEYVETYKLGFKRGYITARFTPELRDIENTTDVELPFLKGFLDGERDHELDMEEPVVYWGEEENLEKDINGLAQDDATENKHLLQWMQKDRFKLFFSKHSDMNKGRDIDQEPER